MPPAGCCNTARPWSEPREGYTVAHIVHWCSQMSSERLAVCIDRGRTVCGVDLSHRYMKCSLLQLGSQVSGATRDMDCWGCQAGRVSGQNPSRASFCCVFYVGFFDCE
ncbi:uncharacterized protein HMPREF1120_02464 [Exophiala dermatitidis NIH/UT8656]|uniref:Uncharacterized protein n=1 Tax=Exophiala dermatitidis (strain ATCC 34100 / CBS 525.76 / NIH/UT8656) TaxID=858893 RepID=H6BT44_EXODN|nr:uncharacterized protein HMPREF1120_02464 [Exophiala dermatitidis NIH/UT8656]EHY54294.1 hypothetical protein HMPREF1120_02464 [Exophiala dermatitidis NIH/UT8656]